jgi:hypothetical protein
VVTIVRAGLANTDWENMVIWKLRRDSRREQDLAALKYRLCNEFFDSNKRSCFVELLRKLRFRDEASNRHSLTYSGKSGKRRIVLTSECSLHRSTIHVYV